ncbi:MAG: NAD(P)H-hydrate dehydratase [bacterium]|nr:NAD(P)H-hydrate dehydratase [bacterium]
MKLVDSAQMARLDRRTIDELGIPALILMENAARAVAESCRDWLQPETTAYVFCGPGNNGGDGYALGRILANAGTEVVAISVGQPKSEEAQQNAAWLRHFAQVIPFEDFLVTLLRPAPHDLVFDALLGTGQVDPLRGTIAEAVDWINHTACRKVALDLPTGIRADSGDALGMALRADRTVTFGLEKLGHHLEPGRSHRGELICRPISIQIEPVEASGFLITAEAAKSWALPRLPTTFKNREGHLVLVCGRRGMLGAAALAAQGALKAGAGLVSLSLPESELSALVAGLPEVMTYPRESTDVDWLSHFSALGLGCGLGRDPGDWVAYRRWIEGFEGPVVLDADAFYGLGNLKGLRPERLVLTPHAGEFAQLTGLPKPTNNLERIEQAIAFAKEQATTLLLKGAPSLVVSPLGELWVNSTGNPGMATAGSGDVLTGVIGALLGRGMEPFDAARLGCWLHGAAGDDYAAQSSGESLTASDLCRSLPQAFARLGL